jgi:hypothetical protein
VNTSWNLRQAVVKTLWSLRQAVVITLWNLRQAVVNILWNLRPSKRRYVAKRSLRFEGLLLKSLRIFV